MPTSEEDPVADLQRKFESLRRAATKELQWLQFEVTVSRLVVAVQRDSVRLQRDLLRRGANRAANEQQEMLAEAGRRRIQVDQLIELRRLVRSKITEARVAERKHGR